MLFNGGSKLAKRIACHGFAKIQDKFKDSLAPEELASWSILFRRNPLEKCLPRKESPDEVHSWGLDLLCTRDREQELIKEIESEAGISSSQWSTFSPWLQHFQRGASGTFEVLSQVMSKLGASKRRLYDFYRQDYCLYQTKKPKGHSINDSAKSCGFFVGPFS